MKKKIWIGLSSMLVIFLLAIMACTKEQEPTYNPSNGGGGGSGGGGGNSTGSAPSAPYGVSCVPTNNGSEVKVSWNSVSNATSYKVYWYKNDSSGGQYDIDNYTLIKTTSGTSFYHYATPRVYNYYCVKAINSYGESPMSSPASCWFGSGKSDVAPFALGSCVQEGE